MLGVLLAALSGLSYGASDYSRGVATDDDPAPVTIAVHTVSFVALIVLLVAFPGDTRPASDLVWGVFGGLGAALGLTAFSMARARGPLSTAVVMTGLIGALAPIGVGLAIDDRPATLALVGVAISVPAVVMLSGSTVAADRRASRPPRERLAFLALANRTRALAAAAGLGFGFFFIALGRTSGDSGVYPLVGARGASVAALAIVVTGQRRWVRPRSSLWWVIGVAGLLDCAALALFLTALDRGLFVWVVAITSLYPAAAVLLSRFFAQERLAPLQVGGLVAAGAALSLIALGR